MDNHLVPFCSFIDIAAPANAAVSAIPGVIQDFQSCWLVDMFPVSLDRYNQADMAVREQPGSLAMVIDPASYQLIDLQVVSRTMGLLNTVKFSIPIFRLSLFTTGTDEGIRWCLGLTDSDGLNSIAFRTNGSGDMDYIWGLSEMHLSHQDALLVSFLLGLVIRIHHYDRTEIYCQQ